MAWVKSKKAKMSVKDIMAEKTYVKTLCPRVKSTRYTIYIFAERNDDKSENYIKQDFADINSFLKELRTQLES